LQVPKKIQNIGKYWHKFRSKTWNYKKKNAMKKFKTCFKIWKMGNNLQIMGKYVVKNHRNSKNLHKNEKYWKSYKKYKNPKIKWKECHTFNIYMVLNITFNSNNVLIHHFWSNEIDH